MQKIITLNDPQLGEVLFHKNNLAKKYIIRVKPDVVKVTIPYLGNYKKAEFFFRENKSFILKKKEELKNKNALKKNVVSACDESDLRLRAKTILPVKVDELAKNYGFKYKAVRINKGRTRWGSCSSKASINLSLYLMQLPMYLIEYVILHELCHTVEMNHGVRFWALLDRCTDGKSKDLRKELRQYRIV
jgi:predicted metal-dependent hydrolase